MFSTAMPVLLFAIAIFVTYNLAGFYGVALAASGMMATTAMQLAIDAFGPIADNAGGIAEMSELPKEVRERTDILDAVGNTTAAIGKGLLLGNRVRMGVPAGLLQLRHDVFAAGICFGDHRLRPQSAAVQAK